MARPLRIEDEGKAIVARSGAVIGSVAAVEDGTAYVRPAPGLMEGWSSWICGPPCDGRTFPLDGDAVVDVDGESVVVEPDRAPRSVAGEK
jgi:hypothetical protein